MIDAQYQTPSATKPLPPSATRNACKLCSPLGAAMVFKGIRGCLPFLHGSQGCATYIRRYLISHFREPVDIASSSFSEDDAIFGGAKNFSTGVDNVLTQYEPELVGVATTCLSETIGDHMTGMIRQYQEDHAADGPPLIHVSTPAYTGTHTDGYFAAILEVVKALVKPPTNSQREGSQAQRINLLPAIMSCSDLRHLRELSRAYGLEATLLPDYSTTLEGASWDAYHRISPGGTTLPEIEAMSAATATVELGHTPANARESAGSWLQANHEVPNHAAGWPLGIRQADAFLAELSVISGQRMPAELEAERGRVVDAYVDAHKYVSGKTAAIFGEPDLVIALAAFLSEIGIRPVICATGAKVRHWQNVLAGEIEGGIADVEALAGADHAKISERARKRRPDLIIGSSKGYPLARELGIPLVRLGFPIHDRIGGQRHLCVGYRGTLELFDRVVNALLEARQNDSETGYSYL